MTYIKRRYGNTWRIISPIISSGTATEPLAPTGVQASSNIGDQADVSWVAPVDDGGSSITGYIINVLRVNAGTSTTFDAGLTTTATVTGLIPGELYEFTVQAQNAVGLSVASSPPVQVLTPGGVNYVMPTLATVGPRQAPTRTISASEALAELRNTGTLSRTTVTGMFSLSGSDGVGWVIEDCRFEGGLYGVRGYKTGDAFTGTSSQRPVFRYCELLGRAAHGNSSNTDSTSAVFYGDDCVFHHTNIYGGIDGIKCGSRNEFRSCWVHDLDHPSGAHSDAVQIVRGVGSVFIANRFDAYVGYSYDGSQNPPSGSTANGVLQTGTVTGDISTLWDHNWFAGGHYTIRGAGNDSRVEYVFQNNRFLRYGESVNLGRTDLQPNRWGPTYGGVTSYEVWVNNVWDDTDELIT